MSTSSDKHADQDEKQHGDQHQGDQHKGDQQKGDQHQGDQHQGDEHEGGGMGHSWKMYLRFAAMIATSMFVMYWTMFVASWEWDHVRFSESRVFMAITMGGTMGLVMIGWMLNMYKSTKLNAVVVAVSLALLGGGIALDRSQATVEDVGWMQAMIPHHSLAITRSVRADISDPRVRLGDHRGPDPRDRRDGLADRGHRGERAGPDAGRGDGASGARLRGPHPA